MVLVELTYSGSTYYVSQDGHALTHLYKQYVQRFDPPPQRRLPVDYGGYCRLEAGGIAFSPALFDATNINTWPPPVQMDITIKYTATTEAAATTLLSGAAHLREITSEAVVYDVYPPDHTTTKAGGTAYNDTLVNVATSICTDLSLTLDSTAARAPSPTVQHTLTTDRLLIDVLSDFCRFYTHFFYIVGTTLYLCDMLADNGTSTIEFKFLPPRYNYNVPVYEVTNNDHSSFGSYGYGRKIYQPGYHGTGTNITAAFDDIITVCNAAWAELEVPFEGTVPAPGEKISWTDTKLQASTDAWIRARHIAYDFDREIIRIEGNGELST
jgi:hypothetical protein